MFYRKKSYEIEPDMLETFNEFFHDYLYPNQLKHGAELVGRWTTDDHRKIYAIWAYKSKEDYERIEEMVRADPMHDMAQKRRQSLPPLMLSSNQEFMEATGNYHVPKHIVTASGVITNERGDLLLVKTYWRDDSWELPGGQVECEEGLEEGVIREIREESGIEAAIDGLTGVYKNLYKGIVNLVFRGRAVGGALKTSDETQDVGFFKCDEETINRLVTRPHWRTRIYDAFGCSPVSAQSYDPRKIK